MIYVPPTPRWYPLRPHERQAELWRCNKRFVVIEAPRRSGKTERMKRKGSRKTWMQRKYNDYFCAFCAPTRDQARNIYWDDLKALQPAHMIESISETHLEITLINGSTIGVVGMDKAERIEGRPVDDIYLDEFANMKDGVWSRTVRPALSTPGRPGCAAIYGVPRPSRQFREISDYAKAQASDPNSEWAYFHWRADGLLSKADLESARATMDPLTFAQEYEAQRVSHSGRAYYAMDRDVHCKPCRQFYNPRAPLLLALDFNVEPGVAAIGQEFEHPELGLIDIWIGEVWIPKGSNTPAVCRKVAADWGTHEGPVYLDGDATGGARRSSSESTDWVLVDEVLRPVFKGGLYSYVPKSNPAERDRVNAMNARLRSTDGKIHTLIDTDHCQRIAADLDEVQLLEGGSGELNKKLDPTLSHISDALGYSTVRRYPLNQSVSVWEHA